MTPEGRKQANIDYCNQLDKNSPAPESSIDPNYFQGSETDTTETLNALGKFIKSFNGCVIGVLKLVGGTAAIGMMGIAGMELIESGTLGNLDGEKYLPSNIDKKTQLAKKSVDDLLNNGMIS